MTVLRFALAAPLLVALSLPAQDGNTQDPQKPQDPQVQQDPEKQSGPTPEQELKNLQNEKLRLQKEIHYAKERAGNAKNLLRSKLTRPEVNYRSIDAGAIQLALPVAPQQQRKAARIATGDELNSQPEGTMLIVDGRGISQTYFDQAMGYMREHAAGDEVVHAQRVLFDLIRTEAMAAAFFESEGEARFGDALGQVQQGKTVAEVATEFGSVAGAAPDGLVEVTRNSPHGPFFEQLAFTTEPGTDARPFRNAFGYVLMHVDSLEKGATPQQDKVICHVAQISYAERSEVAKAQLRVNTGQIEVIARDQQVLDLLPALFKAAAPRAPGNAQVVERRAMIEMQMKEMQMRLQKLEADGAGEGEEAKATRNKLQAMQAALDAIPPEQELPGAGVELEEIRGGGIREEIKEGPKKEGGK